jgi:hypothetical protein
MSASATEVNVLVAASQCRCGATARGGSVHRVWADIHLGIVLAITAAPATIAVAVWLDRRS